MGPSDLRKAHSAGDRARRRPGRRKGLSTCFHGPTRTTRVMHPGCLKEELGCDLSIAFRYSCLRSTTWSPWRSAARCTPAVRLSLTSTTKSWCTLSSSRFSSHIYVRVRECDKELAHALFKEVSIPRNNISRPALPFPSTGKGIQSRSANWPSYTLHIPNQVGCLGNVFICVWGPATLLCGGSGEGCTSACAVSSSRL